MTADIIPFPNPRNAPRVLPPVSDPLAYWLSGGELFRRGDDGRVYIIEAPELRRRRYDHEQVCMREYAVRNLREAKLAARLWREATSALDAMDNHNRIVGKAQ